MSSNSRRKAVVSIIGLLLLSTIPLGIAVHLDSNEIEYQMPRSFSWYWKMPYENYAPHSPGGMPDFNQEQDHWYVIYPGANNQLDTPPLGDDVVSTDGLRIAPGPNCQLESDPIGDDYLKWAFCGPVAVANCFWWFDSKYADPDGTPGDGEDTFSLVEDYGAQDDHDPGNVPYLIQHLATAMKLCSEGTCTIDDMQDAIQQWFVNTGLENQFEENTYDSPTFEFIEAEIERSQDVILLLGIYDYIVGDKLVDQEQPLWDLYIDLPLFPPGHIQSFTPTVDILDALQILLIANYPTPTIIEVSVYDTLPNNPGIIPLGTSIMTLACPTTPTWYQFHFDPAIVLSPGMPYYIAVKAINNPNNVHWCYTTFDSYPEGSAWFCWDDYILEPQLFDFAFKTEYYPPPELLRLEGHYVTCAGVNSEEEMIAISDPAMDIQNPAPTDHNDAQYVSHDIYSIGQGDPTGSGSEWHLIDYPTQYDYAIVEQAVVICPIEDLEPDLDCNGSLIWTDVPRGTTVTGTFTVENIGDPGSELQWEITEYPSWGTWTFNPQSGTGLKPEDGPLTIQVSVLAPKSLCRPILPHDSDFSGSIKIINTDTTTDTDTISVSMTTPINLPYGYLLFLQFLEWIQQILT